MKYLTLGILQGSLNVSPPLSYVTFRAWNLLYYIPKSEETPMQTQVKTYFLEVQKVFTQYPMLPFGFGSFLGSEEEMISILENNQEAISEEWKRMANTAEVRLVFKEGVIKEELPQKLVAPKPGMAFWQKKYQQNAQLQRFQSALTKKEPILDLKTKVKDGKLVFDFLIPKNRIEPFYEGLAQTLKKLSIFQHEVRKPTPPFNFVKLNLKA